MMTSLIDSFNSNRIYLNSFPYILMRNVALPSKDQQWSKESRLRIISPPFLAFNLLGRAIYLTYYNFKVKIEFPEKFARKYSFYNNLHFQMMRTSHFRPYI
jgi:hypothetical protein